jgi:hypothetical protein
MSNVLRIENVVQSRLNQFIIPTIQYIKVKCMIEENYILLPQENIDREKVDSIKQEIRKNCYAINDLIVLKIKDYNEDAAYDYNNGTKSLDFSNVQFNVTIGKEFIIALDELLNEDRFMGGDTCILKIIVSI